MNSINVLLEKIESARDLDFGTIFNESIELFKKVWLQGLVILLLTLLFLLPFYILMYAPMIASGMFDPDYLNNGGQPDMLVLLPFYGLAVLFTFFAMIIGLGLKAAFFRICKHKDFGESASDDYFYFFKKPYLGKTIKLGAISFGLMIGAYLLCFFPIIYMVVPIYIINVLYAFNPDMSASDIVKASFKLGNKKWLITFGLVFVSSLLASIVGMMMCFIGILVTSSFAYLPMYFIYKHVVGFEEKSEIDTIGMIEA